MKFKEYEYSYLREKVLRGKLDNGLTVTLVPKSNFYETYAVLTTQFGAVNTRFQLPNQETAQSYPAGIAHFLEHKLFENPNFYETYAVLTTQFGAVNTRFQLPNQETAQSYPAGIAHFLEHKLFENPNGEDVLHQFAQLGANANAYTSLHQTSYLFSTAQNLGQSLELLLHFVSQPHFTEEAVVKEQGIIIQEIDMYQDDADYRLYTGMLASLYPETPLAYDIAGTAASVQQITAADLYQQFQAFYQPQNMELCIVGRFDRAEVEEILKQVAGQDWLTNQLEVKRAPIEKLPILEHRSEEFEVAMPKLAVGLRGNDSLEPSQVLSYRLCLTLLFSMLMGWISKRYQDLYDGGKIDSSFHFHVEVRPDYHFVVITGDTVEPITLSAILRRAIKEFEKDSDVSEEHLDLLKREMYGDFIKSLNSLESLVSHLAGQIGEEGSIFDIPQLLSAIELEDVLAVGRQFISQADMTDFIIFPK